MSKVKMKVKISNSETAQVCADCDGDGNDIKTTYATKAELAENAALDGKDGAEGLGIFRSSTSTSTSTTSITLSTITIPTGRSIKAGDLIIANTTYSYLYRVAAVSSTTATVTYLASMRGATGATGNTGATGTLSEGNLLGAGTCSTGSKSHSSYSGYTWILVTAVSNTGHKMSLLTRKTDWATGEWYQISTDSSYFCFYSGGTTSCTVRASSGFSTSSSTFRIYGIK